MKTVASISFIIDRKAVSSERGLDSFVNRIQAFACFGCQEPFGRGRYQYGKETVDPVDLVANSELKASMEWLEGIMFGNLLGLDKENWPTAANLNRYKAGARCDHASSMSELILMDKF